MGNGGFTFCLIIGLVAAVFVGAIFSSGIAAFIAFIFVTGSCANGIAKLNEPYNIQEIRDELKKMNEKKD